MSRLFLRFKITTAAFLVLTSAGPAFAAEQAVLAPESAVQAADTSASSEPSGVSVTVSEPLTVLQAVAKGRELLKAELAARSAANLIPASVSSQPVWANVALAVWDKDTDEVTVVNIRKSGPRIEVKTPGDWPLSIAYDNRIYSQYVLPDDRHQLVVGVVYPVARKVSNTRYDLHDTYYVPYQNAFYRPEVIAAGSDYLSNVIQAAFDELRAKGVKSRAYPDRLVADVVDPYLMKSIVVIEHSSHQMLLRADDPERGLGIFYAKLAINGEDAFDVALSSAGASGLAQFMPNTYALFAKNRPQYGLIQDFAAGMADHRNAVKAEIAYLDDALASMNGTVRETYSVDQSKAAEYLAAAYNGGSARVNRSIAAYGSGWTAGLRPETKTYVAKLQRAYSMLTAGMFSTPHAPVLDQPLIAAVQVAPPPSASGPVASASQTYCFGDGSCHASS